MNFSVLRLADPLKSIVQRLLMVPVKSIDFDPKALKCLRWRTTGYTVRINAYPAYGIHFRPFQSDVY